MTISVTSSDSNNKKIKINKELLMRLAPLFSLIILVVFFSFSSPFFFNTENIMTIALQTSVIGIMAIGDRSFLRVGGGVFRRCGGHLCDARTATSGLHSGGRAGRGIVRLHKRSAGDQNDDSAVHRHPGADDVRQRNQHGHDGRSRHLFC